MADHPATRNRLILFTRAPEPGKVKTRLIPFLGADGAAALHRRMGEDALIQARQLQKILPVELRICFAGGNEELVRQWLGDDLDRLGQGMGDLGVRMSRAFAEAMQSGDERVVLMGTDCPGITASLLAQAFQALRDHDLVLGPAKDGGYYLIGLKRAAPPLFTDMPWGSGAVLEKTLQAAGGLGLRHFLLETLEDVDRPEDLPAWERLRGQGPLISVIIPALNEEQNILGCLERTREAANLERIVVDGGSRDRTAEIARSWGARVLTSPRGRARQMNAGAATARGDLFLFLHADTLLPAGFEREIREAAARADFAAGAFSFLLDESSRSLKIIERVANWRSRRLQLPYGDQAIFLSSRLFREVGGYPDQPIMEDFEFVRRLRRRGRIVTLPAPATTSARRWRAQGVWKTTLINEWIVIAYYLGLPPSRIHSWVRGKE